MTAATFDTLAAARNLENAGMNRDLAEAVAVEIRTGQGDLVTRQDLHSESTGLRAEISSLETKITNRLYAAAFGIVIANTALTVGSLKLLAPDAAP